MALTGIYGPVERDEAVAVIRRAFDLGITHYDTAELYGPYVNEELLAEALGPRSREVCIATKFGYRLEGSSIAGLDSSPRAIRRSVEGSLRRLRRERLDLLYQHRPDPHVPVEDVIGTMSELVEEGKVASRVVRGRQLDTSTGEGNPSRCCDPEQLFTDGPRSRG